MFGCPNTWRFEQKCNENCHFSWLIYHWSSSEGYSKKICGEFIFRGKSTKLNIANININNTDIIVVIKDTFLLVYKNMFITSDIPGIYSCICFSINEKRIICINLLSIIGANIRNFSYKRRTSQSVYNRWNLSFLCKTVMKLSKFYFVCFVVVYILPPVTCLPQQ